MARAKIVDLYRMNLNRVRYKSRKKFLDLKKGLFLLPNLFTLGNAFLGYLSIVFTAHSEFVVASYFILLAALFDALDGRIARMLGATSELGLQLDSFADAISFSLAPAILTYFWYLKSLGIIGFFVTAIFFLAGLIRLAKFNLTSAQQTDFFLGLPAPVAGCFLVAIFLNFHSLLPKYPFVFFILFLKLFLAFLMLSSIRFPTLKTRKISGKKNWFKILFLLLFAFIAVMRFQLILLVLFLIYFFFSLFYLVKNKFFRRVS